MRWVRPELTFRFPDFRGNFASAPSASVQSLFFNGLARTERGRCIVRQPQSTVRMLSDGITRNYLLATVAPPHSLARGRCGSCVAALALALIELDLDAGLAQEGCGAAQPPGGREGRGTSAPSLRLSDVLAKGAQKLSGGPFPPFLFNQQWQSKNEGTAAATRSASIIDPMSIVDDAVQDASPRVGSAITSCHWDTGT